MQNFQLIAKGLDPWPLLHSLQTQPELWNSSAVRKHWQSVHKDVDDIMLRYNAWSESDDYLDKVCSSLVMVDYPAWYKLPPAQVFVYFLLQKVGGLHLGRVMISRLKPGGIIPPHSDRIDAAEAAFPDRVPPATYFERYHVCLQSGPGSIFMCEEEQVTMLPGEVWWFNNQLIHGVVNNSADDRIHLIIDIRTRHDDYIPA